MTPGQRRRLWRHIIAPFLVIFTVFSTGAVIAAALDADPVAGMAIAFGGAIGLVLLGLWVAIGVSLVMDDRCRCREAREDDAHYCIAVGRFVGDPAPAAARFDEEYGE